MKLKTTLFVLLASCAIMSTAQTKEKKLGIGLQAGLNEYVGDLGNGIFKFKNNNPFGALSIATYISPSINMGVQGSYGNYGFKSTNALYTGKEFFGNKYDASMFVDYKFNNGYILSESAKLSPFISLGIGMAGYNGDAGKINPFPLDLIVPVGAGIKYQISSSFAIQYKYLYNFTNHDEHDLIRMNEKNDKYGQQILGFVLSFGKKEKQATPPIAKPTIIVEADSDGDGVPDHADLCPDTPRGVKVDKNGCPLDKDGDGVPDYLDKCPEIPGPASNKGCPEEVTKMIDFLERIQFEFDSQVIKVESFPLMDEAYKILKANPKYKLEIAGHTDNIGTEAYNQDLSERRARSVYNYLTIKGIEAERVKYAGFGSTKPIAGNDTAEGRAKNRRVEFKVTL